MHEIFSRIVRIYSQSYLIKFALLVCTSRPVGQSGHFRQWEEPKREPLLSRTVGFPNPGGRSLVVVAPPLEPLTRRATETESRPAGLRGSRTEGSGGQAR